MKNADQNNAAIALSKHLQTNTFVRIITFNPQKATLSKDDLLAITPYAGREGLGAANTTLNIDATIPSNTPDPSHHLFFSYLYRDAGNYKQYAEVALAGAYSAQDLATLLTVLCGNADGFIPSQIGLTDLQKYSDKAMDENDHVWHESIRLSTTPQAPDHTTSWDNIRPLINNILRKDYDVSAAMQDVGIF